MLTHSSGIMALNSPGGSTLQCSSWLWDDMPFSQTSAILEFYIRFRFRPYHRSRQVILCQSPKFYPNRTTLGKYSNIVFMNSVMSSRITIAYLLMALKKVTELLLLLSIETTPNVFDYLMQQAFSELNYMPFCLR